MVLLSNKELVEGLRVALVTTVVRTRHLDILSWKDDWRERSFFFRHNSTWSNREHWLKWTGDLCDLHTLSGSCLLHSLLKCQPEGVTLSSGISCLFRSLPSLVEILPRSSWPSWYHGHSDINHDQSLQSHKKDGGGRVLLQRDLFVTLSWWLEMVVLCLTILKRLQDGSSCTSPQIRQRMAEAGRRNCESSRCRAQGLSGLPGSCLSHAPLKPNRRHPGHPALRNMRGMPPSQWFHFWVISPSLTLLWLTFWMSPSLPSLPLLLIWWSCHYKGSLIAQSW